MKSLSSHILPPLLALKLILYQFLSGVHAKNDHSAAWNGQTTEGSDTTQANSVPFTPFWVPYGSKLVDDTDDDISWLGGTGDWTKHVSNDYINGTIHTGTQAGASFIYKFKGSGIEWYGCKSPYHGKAAVWIDGKWQERINLYSENTYCQQIIWKHDDLDYGLHTIKVTVLGTQDKRANGRRIDVDALVIDETAPQRSRERRYNINKIIKRLKQPSTNENLWTVGQTRLAQTGELGVSAMQISVVDDSHMIIIDKVEHNTLTVNGHPAWGSIYNFNTGKERPLDLQSNSFCAGGSWLSNGTLINVGGNPVTSDHTGSADFGDVNGLQAIRMFNPCPDSEDCGIYEDPKRIRMAGARWYSSVARLPDGSVFIMGGAIKGGWINNQTVNNPSIEYYPAKNLHGSNGLPIHSPFLAETLNANLFPIIFHLPNDRIFVAANTKAMIYDYQANTEQRLPDIPNGIRITYPMTAGAVMLPLSEENGYTPEVLICGGSNVDDTLPSWEISSQAPASDQCIRMALNDQGIAAGWQVEHMPQARLMPDLVLLPNGDILIVNGAQTGVAGYGNVKDQAGQSNADNPAYTPVVYRPSAPAGTRFLTDIAMPSSDIARLYHSVATLLPSGDVLIAGSNPNLDRTNVRFPTEYRVETLSPPYMATTRPSYSNVPGNIPYGGTFDLQTDLPDTILLDKLKVSLVDLGFITHSIHMNSRLVTLKVNSISSGTIQVQGPPSNLIYPPGPGWLYLLNDGIPSVGKKIMVGNGNGPPVDEAAISHVLASTETIAKDK